MPPERRKTPEHDWRPFVQALGRRVSGLRDQRSWTQLDLANASGLSARSVELIELGKSSWEGAASKPSNPTLDTICLLAAALGLTPAELLEPLGSPLGSVPGSRHAPGVRPRPHRGAPADR